MHNVKVTFQVENSPQPFFERCAICACQVWGFDYAKEVLITEGPILTKADPPSSTYRNIRKKVKG